MEDLTLRLVKGQKEHDPNWILLLFRHKAQSKLQAARATDELMIVN